MSLGKNYFKVRLVFPGHRSCTIESRRDVEQNLDSIEDMLREALHYIDSWKEQQALELQTRRSRAWITKNDVSLDNVVRPTAAIEDASAFRRWLSVNDGPPFVEWNGRLYQRDHFIAGCALNCADTAPGLYDDLVVMDVEAGAL